MARKSQANCSSTKEGDSLRRNLMVIFSLVVILMSIFATMRVTIGASEPKVSGADLAVSMDYKRDLSDGYGYKTKDEKTIYGADTVIYTITVANHGPNEAGDVTTNDLPPSGLKFMSSTASQGTYDAQSGNWDVGSLAVGEHATLQLKAKVIQSGAIENTATLPDDLGRSNGLATATFVAHNPVILVHGFDNPTGIQYPGLWTNLMTRLDTEGIRYYKFDYNNDSTQDPALIARAVFEPWINQKKAELGYGGAPYSGKFDTIGHSMGPLVTRFYIENNSANAQNIDQWIGIGPTSKGTALVDVYCHQELARQLGLGPVATSTVFQALGFVVPLNSPAVFHMQTTDPEIVALNEHFTAKNVNYKIIEGTDATLAGVKAIEKTASGQYRFTLQGDGLVANSQSELPGVPVYKVHGVNHIALITDSSVIDKVVEYLKT